MGRAVVVGGGGGDEAELVAEVEQVGGLLLAVGRVEGLDPVGPQRADQLVDLARARRCPSRDGRSRRRRRPRGSARSPARRSASGAARRPWRRAPGTPRRRGRGRRSRRPPWRYGGGRSRARRRPRGSRPRGCRSKPSSPQVVDDLPGPGDALAAGRAHRRARSPPGRPSSRRCGGLRRTRARRTSRPPEPARSPVPPPPPPPPATPAIASWSVSARVVTPAFAASATTSAGASWPSETVEWLCSSINMDHRSVSLADGPSVGEGAGGTLPGHSGSGASFPRRAPVQPRRRRG